jgi:hypothetical protein
VQERAHIGQCTTLSSTPASHSVAACKHKGRLRTPLATAYGCILGMHGTKDRGAASHSPGLVPHGRPQSYSGCAVRASACGTCDVLLLQGVQVEDRRDHQGHLRPNPERQRETEAAGRVQDAVKLAVRQQEGWLRTCAPTRNRTAVAEIDLPTGVVAKRMNTTPGLHRGSGSKSTTDSMVWPARNT